MEYTTGRGRGRRGRESKNKHKEQKREKGKQKREQTKPIKRGRHKREQRNQQIIKQTKRIRLRGKIPQRERKERRGTRDRRQMSELIVIYYLTLYTIAIYDLTLILHYFYICFIYLYT